MEFSEIRELLLRQHTEIKAIIRALECDALRVAGGDARALGALEAQLGLLSGKFAVHTAAEREYVASIPLDAKRTTPERLKRLAELHAGAHDSMERAAAEAADFGRLPTLRAAGALALVTALREHMRVEEKYVLGHRVMLGDALLGELGG